MPLATSNVSVQPRATTYRATFNVTAVAGQAVVISGSASKTVYIKEIFFTKPSGAVILTGVKQSTATTGGTSTAVTAVPLDSANAAATASTLQYTAAPTPGTSVGEVFRDSVATTDRVLYQFATDVDGQRLVLRGTAQQLALTLDAGASVRGYIEWLEQ